MPTEKIGEFDIEYSGVALACSDNWGAYVTIYGKSPNPMHRNSIFPPQRVALNNVFLTQAEAESAAREFAVSMVEMVE